jgi:hypothetical protein
MSERLPSSRRVASEIEVGCRIEVEGHEGQWSIVTGRDLDGDEMCFATANGRRWLWPGEHVDVVPILYAVGAESFTTQEGPDGPLRFPEGPVHAIDKRTGECLCSAAVEPLEDHRWEPPDFGFQRCEECLSLAR